MLVEAMMALSVLTVLGMVLLKLSLNILHPRQWVMQQAVTDGYMTYERAFAERIPFENLVANDSPFPEFPATRSTSVEVGRLPATRSHPNGVPITGTVVRTRTQDLTNFPVATDAASVATNPSAMRVWKAQSVLTYRIGNRTYAKSRTILRSQ